MNTVFGSLEPPKITGRELISRPKRSDVHTFPERFIVSVMGTGRKWFVACGCSLCSRWEYEFTMLHGCWLFVAFPGKIEHGCEAFTCDVAPAVHGCASLEARVCCRASGCGAWAWMRATCKLRAETYMARSENCNSACHFCFARKCLYLVSFCGPGHHQYIIITGFHRFTATQRQHNFWLHNQRN